MSEEPKDAPRRSPLPTVLVAVVAVLVLGVGAWWWNRPAPLAESPADDRGNPDALVQTRAAAPAAQQVEPTGPPSFAFEDVSGRLTAHFTQTSGNSPEKHFPAANGSGVAMVDYDGDGRLDLYYLTARPLPFTPGTPGPRNSLYRALPDGTYAEVAPQAGVDLSLFCHGVDAGDLNADGFPDLLVTTYGQEPVLGTRMLLNNGDGTYTHGDQPLDPRWGSSVATADLNGDGVLDAYVTHYGVWSPETNPFCGGERGAGRMFCRPTLLTAERDGVYFGDGAGGYREMGHALKIDRDDGRGQGVMLADLNLDGRTDVYVANDMSPNFLFLGRAGGAFEDLSLSSGAAHSRAGDAQAGMGIDAGDSDRDGLPDLFVTNFAGEYNTLYLGEGYDTFMDRTASVGLAVDAMPEVGWGTRLTDLDNDGWLDLFVTNGHVDDNIENTDSPYRYAQPAKFWHNERSRFRLAAVNKSGAYFRAPHVGRGAAFGDLDNDGWTDIAVNHIDAPAALLRNATATLAPGNHWLRLDLVGRRGNRDAVGAVVTVRDPSLGFDLIDQRRGGGSYLSSHDPRLLLGVGAAGTLAEVEVRWPSGAVTRLTDVAVGQTLQLREPLDAEPAPVQ